MRPKIACLCSLLLLLMTRAAQLRAQSALQPAQVPQAQRTQEAKRPLLTGRFQIVGKDVSPICALLCRIDTETGRVWTLIMGKRTGSDGKEESSPFWAYLPEDTDEAFSTRPIRSLP